MAHERIQYYHYMSYTNLDPAAGIPSFSSGVGPNIALHASPAVRNSAFLTAVFVVEVAWI